MADDSGGASPKKVTQLSANVEPFVPRQNFQLSSNGNEYYPENQQYYPVLAVVRSPQWPPIAVNGIVNRHYLGYEFSNVRNVTGDNVMKYEDNYSRSRPRNNSNVGHRGGNFNSSRREDGIKFNSNELNNWAENIVRNSSRDSKSPGKGTQDGKKPKQHTKVSEDIQNKFEDVAAWPALGGHVRPNTVNEPVNATTSFASILKKSPSNVEPLAVHEDRQKENSRTSGARAKEPGKSPKRDTRGVREDRDKVCDREVDDEKVPNSKEKTERPEGNVKGDTGKEKVKPKRRTQGQIKQERRNAVKALPSTQGTVGFISEKLRDLILTSEDRGNPVKQTQIISTNSSGLSKDDFPVLGSRVKSKQDNIEKLEPAVKVLPSTTNKYDFDFPALGLAETKKEILQEKQIEETKDKVLPVTNLAQSPGTSGLVKSKILPGLKPIGKKPKITSLIQLDIGHMLAKSKTKSKRIAAAKYMFKNPKKSRKSVSVVANRLDSSAPKMRRGKMREMPIKKKPSTFKKIILKERGVKQLQRLMLQLEQSQLAETTRHNDDKEEENSSEGVGEGISKFDVKLPEEIPTLPEIVISPAKALIHTRRFREYCDHMLSSNIDKVVTTLVQDLIRFHDRLYHKDPIKAKMRRRLVLGFREVLKHLRLKRLKCIILAPNLEKIQSAGGVDDTTNAIIQLANEQNLPLAFALGRKALGRICLKKVPVSCIGIFNYDGSENNYKKLLNLVAEARVNYTKQLQEAEETVQVNETKKQSNVIIDPPISIDSKQCPVSNEISK